MSEDTTDFCRLCLASDNLICMFTGKRRKLRDDLRKMIQEIVTIKIEHSDEIPWVCFNCLVDITNFYYFRLQCLQNQANFTTTTLPKIRKPNIDSSPVETLPSPNLDSTNAVHEWLSLKRKDVWNAASNSKSTQCDNIVTVSIESRTLGVELKSQLVQTAAEVSVKSVQTDKEKNSKSRSSKEPRVRLRNSYSQTTETAADLENRSSNRKILKEDRCRQTDANEDFAVSKVRHTHKNPISSKSQSTQTDGLESIDKFTKSNAKRRRSSMKNGCYFDLTSGDDCQSDIHIVSGAIVASKISQIDTIPISSNSVSTQTDQLEWYHKSSQLRTRGRPRKQPSHDVDNTSSDCQTDISINPVIDGTIVVNYMNGACAGNFKTPTTSVLKHMFKEEKLSPLEQLKISITPTANDRLSASPTSPNLLLHKSDVVYVCNICDKVMYKKCQLVLHKRAHLKCPICKRRFRSVLQAQEHLNSCKLDVLNTPEELQKCNFSVYVDLVRVDHPSVGLLSAVPKTPERVATIRP